MNDSKFRVQNCCVSIQEIRRFFHFEYFMCERECVCHGLLKQFDNIDNILEREIL